MHRDGNGAGWLAEEKLRRRDPQPRSERQRQGLSVGADLRRVASTTKRT
jgi:hypothetical protein